MTDQVKPAETDGDRATVAIGARGKIWGAIAVFGVFSVVALATLYAAWDENIDAERWSRILVIFSSLEALGFAAAGVLIGSTIESPTRRTLEARAQDAEARLKASAEAIEEIEESLALREGGAESGLVQAPSTTAQRLATVRRMMVPRR